MILVNQKKWQSLSPKTREILQRVAIEHESSSLKALQELWKKEQAELQKRGIKTSRSRPRPRSGSSPARAPRACSA